MLQHLEYTPRVLSLTCLVKNPHPPPKVSPDTPVVDTTPPNGIISTMNKHSNCNPALPNERVLFQYLHLPKCSLSKI
jgi:hypothetical protein